MKTNAVSYVRTAAISQNTIGYTRVSSQEQVKEGNSLEAQKQNIEKYCYMKEMNLIEVICEPGISAGVPLSKRIGGQRLNQIIKEGEIKSVVVTKLDRLFRNANDCLNTIKDWETENIGLHIIDLGGQTINTRETAGKLLISLLAVMAEWEKNIIRDRTIEAMQFLKSNNRYTGGHSPYGFKFGPNKELELNEDEQKVIQIICKLRADGESVTQISKYLIENDIKSRGNKPICNAQIIKIIRNQLKEEPPKRKRSRK